MPISLAVSVRGGVVLLVEDDNEVSALTREMLGCLGFSVIHVMNPGGALYVLAEARTVDVVSVRHHDARRDERTGVRPRNPATLPTSADRFDDGLRRGRVFHETVGIQVVVETL